MNQEIIIYTSIKPEKYNKGNPSSLIYKIFYEIKKNERFYSNIELIIYLNFIKNKKLNILKKLNTIFYLIPGIINKSIKLLFRKVTLKIIAYPGNISISLLWLKLIFWNKTNIVCIGPDATSLLFKRIIKINKFNFYYIIGYQIIKIQEFISLIICKKYFVVGEIDCAYMKNKYPFFKNKIFYLIHPSSGQIDSNFLPEYRIYKKKLRLIIFGDCSKKYIGDPTFLNKTLKNSLKNHFNKILILGKNNLWLFNSINKQFIKNEISVEYIEWVDEIESFFNPLTDIHFFPLGAGTGTKNRVLLSQKNACFWIGSKISFENIPPYFVDQSGLIYKSYKELSEYLLNIKEYHNYFLKIPKNNLNTVLKRRDEEFIAQIKDIF